MVVNVSKKTARNKNLPRLILDSKEIVRSYTVVTI